MTVLVIPELEPGFRPGHVACDTNSLPLVPSLLIVSASRVTAGRPHPVEGTNGS